MHRLTEYDEDGVGVCSELQRGALQKRHQILHTLELEQLRDCLLLQEQVAERAGCVRVRCLAVGLPRRALLLLPFL